MNTIKSKVIMLPSDTGVILLDKLFDNIQLSIYQDGDLKEEISKDVIGRMPYTLSRCHLYFTSDEKIKEGDWCYYSNGLGGNIICQAYKHLDDKRMLFDDGTHNRKIGEGITPLNGECKKIIATTDPKLINQSGNMMYKSDECALPQSSNEFLELYCKLGEIDEVLVEVEWKPDGTFDTLEEDLANIIYSNKSSTNPYKLLINPDNIINIHQIKDSWSREEVKELLHNAYNSGFSEASDLCCGPMDNTNKDSFDWIKENLI